jgi:hypothetical protein
MRPDVIFTHHPERPIPSYLCHPDHRAVGRAVLDAVYPLTRDRLALLSYPAVAALLPYQVKEVWLFASAEARCLTGPLAEAIVCGSFLNAERVWCSAAWGQLERKSAVLHNTCPRSLATRS